MRNDIKLFINEEEVEFSTDPKILLNYKETELHNPTVVRNAFTKQITLEGTPRNNEVFGHIWDLSRLQEGNFNPIKKTDFQLFVNDELFQKGYVKLDKVTRTNNTTQYAITLYGGLGSFLYNLTYDQDDESNTKKTLASLKYTTDELPEPELDFAIDKDNVYEAWGQIAGFGTTSNDRWNVINFIPALNGIPGDFDAAKVLINNYQLNQGGASGFANGKTENGKTYRPVINGLLSPNGFSLGEMSDDLQEWQTRDLRSYNQRPCISMRRIIQACCQPENNGGYQVKLDNHFFRTTNPYYWDAWVTMPLLKDLEGVEGGETYEITGATISQSSSSYGSYMHPVNFSTTSLTSINNIKMSVSVRFSPSTTTSAQALYPYHTYHSNANTLQGNTYVRDFESNQGVILQLFALSQTGEVVGQSKAYLLAGQKYWNRTDKNPMWEKFWETDKYGTEPEFEYVPGYFKLSQGTYVFCNEYGDQTNLNFSFSAPSDFTNLVMKIEAPFSRYTKFALVGSAKQKDPATSVPSLYTSRSYSTTGNHTEGEAVLQDRVLGSYVFVVDEMEGVGTDYEGLFSGTKITKERLLTTQNTPADYLLSYCKMFGLYFYYDSTEEADDPVKYPSGVVHIMDRDTFYTEEVIDLSKMIDWDKKVDITPAMATTKWYKFDTEHVESELDTGYREQYGKDYGAQLVNTNYNFNGDTTNLYDGNVFKTAIMALEKDKYYKKSPAGLPVYPYNGLEYNLFYRSGSSEDFETTTIEYPVKTTTKMLTINPDYEFFDGFPKLQLHGENNEPVDGENVLVFYKSSVPAEADYWITDDVREMVTLNDGSPCWLLTRSEYDATGNHIARKLNYFPFYTRDLILYGQPYGNIVHSWNFGHPQVIYSPDTYSTDGDSIYDICWRDYIRDLYNENTRKLTCYVKAEMDNRPWPYWLRRFYWFENSIWRLNSITDLNVGSFDTTKMEFIKVQDVNNYKLAGIEYQGQNQVILNQTSIGCQGGTITGTIYLQGAGGWAAADFISGVDGEGNEYGLQTAAVMTPYRGQGQYATPFSITVPENSANTPITWTVNIEDDFDVWYRSTFVENTCNTASTLAVYPTNATVGSRSGRTIVTIAASNVTGITASSNVEWVETVLSGNMLYVNYIPNTTIVTRTARITLEGTGVEGPITTTFTLNQRGLGPINTSKSVIWFDYFEAGATDSFQVSTEDIWTSSIDDIDNN